MALAVGSRASAKFRGAISLLLYKGITRDEGRAIRRPTIVLLCDRHLLNFLSLFFYSKERFALPQFAIVNETSSAEFVCLRQLRWK